MIQIILKISLLAMLWDCICLWAHDVNCHQSKIYLPNHIKCLSK